MTETSESPPFLLPTPSATGFAFNLPDDLIRVVIEQLEGSEDRAVVFKTLEACSAVSRQWRGATMSLLFTHIHLRCESSPTFVEEFTEFLAERPLLAHCVKYLTLSSRADWYYEQDMIPNIDTQVLGSLLSLLPHLDTLKLDSVCIFNSQTRPQAPRALILDKLEWPMCVSIPAGRSRAGKSLTDTLNLSVGIRRFEVFSNNETLTPRVDRRLCTMYTDSPAHRPEARIDHLRIMAGFHPCEFFLTNLLSTNASYHLTSLDVGPIDLLDVQAVGKLLPNSGRTLRAVGIDLLGFEYGHDLDGDVIYDREGMCTALRTGLSHCSSLHHFQLTGEIILDFDFDWPIPELWLRLVDIITLIPTHTLRHLAVHLEWHTRHPLSPWVHELVEWRVFRKACRRFTRLSSITLGCQRVGSDTAWTNGDVDHVRSQMREFHEKGLLHVGNAKSAPSCSDPGCCWYDPFTAET